MIRVLLALCLASSPAAAAGAAQAVPSATNPPPAAAATSAAPRPFTPPPSWTVVARPPSTTTPPSGTLTTPTSVPPPTSYAPVPATLPPRPTLPPVSLLNHSEAQVKARLGTPEVARREAGGALWTYATEACALMVFFQSQGREGLRVTGAQAGPRQRGQRAPEVEACIAATAANPRRG